MPELAEVEFYRKRWNAGLGKKIVRVELHVEKRIFRQTNPDLIRRLPGQKLLNSFAHGKQMLFEFSGSYWMGVHLGMSGELRTEPVGYEPAKHDHLVWYTKDSAFVFEDQRLFGLVLFEKSASSPEWWAELPPPVSSNEFTLEFLHDKLGRSKTAPVKALLLDQAIFPGVGNWVADEILWQAGIRPHRSFSSLSAHEVSRLWETTRYVCSKALETIGEDIENVPKGWLFDERWGSKGICPKHKKPLHRETVGGRTSAFCPLCQK